MNLSDLNVFLKGKRDFLIELLENPVLVGHKGFSECLPAVFHLHDELGCRSESLVWLKSTASQNDMNLAYGRPADPLPALLERLQSQYPSIFSLSIRDYPFDPKADPIVRG